MDLNSRQIILISQWAMTRILSGGNEAPSLSGMSRQVSSHHDLGAQSGAQSGAVAASRSRSHNTGSGMRQPLRGKAAEAGMELQRLEEA